MLSKTGAAMNVVDLWNAARSRSHYLIYLGSAVALVALITPVLLDADEADLRYDRQSIVGNRVNLPTPGDAYIYDHNEARILPRKLCKFEVSDTENPIATVSFKGINDWGRGVNGAMSQVGQLVGEKILAGMQVNGAVNEWAFTKQFRTSSDGAKFNPECVGKVLELMRSSDQSVLIVDTVYYHNENPEDVKMVQLSKSNIVPADCGLACSNSVELNKLLDVGWITRQKAKWDLVRIQ
ncbi:hypothetical protein [Roseovarius sp. EL26]|uniref:hypothetical protein n=1 Tax=Roseovarius sp. EL26 TaxID=2126672 RepID=UPI000EA214E0|nr:hypothetical protein [Roseovarius sp. EL26]